MLPLLVGPLGRLTLVPNSAEALLLLHLLMLLFFPISHYYYDLLGERERERGGGLIYHMWSLVLVL